MLKLLIWLAIGLAAVFWFRASKRRQVAPPPETKPGVEDMVRCKVCGVNLPRSEAILSRGRFYCSPEHQQQDHG